MRGASVRVARRWCFSYRKAHYILSHAEADVEEIIDYYLFENQSVYAAETVNREFHAAFRTLADSPGQGHLREDLTDKPFRFWRVRSYLIVYRPRDHPHRSYGSAAWPA